MPKDKPLGIVKSKLIKKATKEEIKFIKDELVSAYGDAKTELNYTNRYELLVAIILSAQCTDKRVNIITPALFEKYPSTFELSIANLDDVKALLNTCSFFNNKAKNIIKMAQSIENNFSGKIPRTNKELQSLAGVGQKTANVFMIEFEGANLMAVDTHVFRVSHRLGLSRAKTAIETEKDLSKIFKDELDVLHQGFVLFGRYICKAVNPKCDECLFPQHCKSKEVDKLV
jgi:endonuclease-3